MNGNCVVVVVGVLVVVATVAVESFAAVGGESSSAKISILGGEPLLLLSENRVELTMSNCVVWRRWKKVVGK